MVRAMLAADDLFFDVISQIRMPGWSRGPAVATTAAALARRDAMLRAGAVAPQATGALRAHPARIRRRSVTRPTLEA